MVIENPWTGLRELTAARLALGRCGHSLPTRELLAFQLAHARARDAVHQPLIDSSLMEIGLANQPVLVLRSAAPDRATYLRRPDLGRRLDPASLDRLSEHRREPDAWDAVVVIADGLSATAVHRNAAAVLDSLLPRLQHWRIGPCCIVHQGRVAIGDEIGEVLETQLVVVLIGERTGLSSADSLGAYLTWAPRIGRSDAERNCVSNIRSGGLEPALAAQQIAVLMSAARDRKLTGVNLKTPPLLR